MSRQPAGGGIDVEGRKGLDAAEGTSGSDAVTDAVLTVPNLLSFLRLGAVPVFLVLFVSGRTDAAVLLYAIAAWTDFFDGYIARRTDSVSSLGQLLDPLADRVFIAALVIALVATDVLSLWLALLVVGRDILVLALYPVVRSAIGVRIPVSFTGKSATAALLTGLTFLAVAQTSLSWGEVFEAPGLGLVVVGAALYWISGWMYARQALELSRSAARGGSER